MVSAKLVAVIDIHPVDGTCGDKHFSARSLDVGGESSLSWVAVGSGGPLVAAESIGDHVSVTGVTEEADGTVLVGDHTNTGVGTVGREGVGDGELRVAPLGVLLVGGLLVGWVADLLGPCLPLVLELDLVSTGSSAKDIVGAEVLSWVLLSPEIVPEAGSDLLVVTSEGILHILGEIEWLEASNSGGALLSIK